jgi:hypothetical protein
MSTSAIQLRERGMTLAAIAEALGISRVEVLQQLVDAGLIADTAAGRANAAPGR